MRLFYKIFSYILSFPMLLYTIEKGIFDSTLYFYAYNSMLTVLLVIMFLYFLAFMDIPKNEFQIKNEYTKSFFNLN